MIKLRTHCYAPIYPEGGPHPSGWLWSAQYSAQYSAQNCAQFLDKIQSNAKFLSQNASIKHNFSSMKIERKMALVLNFFGKSPLTQDMSCNWSFTWTFVNGIHRYYYFCAELHLWDIFGIPTFYRQS
jgi:hypothetical protein